MLKVASVVYFICGCILVLISALIIPSWHCPTGFAGCEELSYYRISIMAPSSLLFLIGCVLAWKNKGLASAILAGVSIVLLVAGMVLIY